MFAGLASPVVRQVATVLQIYSRGRAVSCGELLCVPFQTSTLEVQRDEVQAQLARAQSELETAKRAQSAAAAVKRQQDKSKSRVTALQQEKAAMEEKQVSWSWEQDACTTFGLARV